MKRVVITPGDLAIVGDFDEHLGGLHCTRSDVIYSVVRIYCTPETRSSGEGWDVRNYCIKRGILDFIHRLKVGPRGGCWWLLYADDREGTRGDESVINVYIVEGDTVML
jgi:hypothetical protein